MCHGTTAPIREEFWALGRAKPNGDEKERVLDPWRSKKRAKRAKGLKGILEFRTSVRGAATTRRGAIDRAHQADQRRRSVASDDWSARVRTRVIPLYRCQVTADPQLLKTAAPSCPRRYNRIIPASTISWACHRHSIFPFKTKCCVDRLRSPIQTLPSLGRRASSSRRLRPSRSRWDTLGSEHPQSIPRSRSSHRRTNSSFGL